MIKTVIIDEEQPAVDILKHMLTKTGQADVIGTYTSPARALHDIAHDLHPDAVFLDTEMHELNGLAAAERIISLDPHTAVVFVTARNDYAIKAFEINALDYLLKPVLPDRLNKTLQRIISRQRTAAVSARESGRIQCLGSFETFAGSAPASPIKWRTSKTEELFAFLLCNRDTIVSKSKIIENLWPDDEGSQADTNLHTTIYKLRKALKTAGIDIEISLSGRGYLLRSGAVYCDAAVLENFIKKRMPVTAQTINEFTDIIALYRGNYLDDKDYLWCLAERERILKHFTDICKNAAHYYLDNDAVDKAIDILNKATVMNPFDENASEMLMTAYARGRYRAALVRHYDHFKKILSDELGFEPRPSTRQLYEQLLSKSYKCKPAP